MTATVGIRASVEGNSPGETGVRHVMARAMLNGVVIAESDETVIVEGNHYFPPGSIKKEFFSGSPKTTVCGWKGTASYYDVTVDGATSPSAAWYYPSPKDAASGIKDYVAFWGDIRVDG